MNDKRLLIIAAVLAMLAVVLGAFGAHTLENLLTEKQLGSFETGVRYQFYHSLAIFIVWILGKQLNRITLLRSGWLFTIGILLFSGSIFLLSCRDLLGIENYKWLGPLTPIGGALFIIGWGLLVYELIKVKENDNNL